MEYFFKQIFFIVQLLLTITRSIRINDFKLLLYFVPQGLWKFMIEHNTSLVYWNKKGWIWIKIIVGALISVTVFSFSLSLNSLDHCLDRLLAENECTQTLIVFQLDWLLSFEESFSLCNWLICTHKSCKFLSFWLSPAFVFLILRSLIFATDLCLLACLVANVCMNVELCAMQSNMLLLFHGFSFSSF